MVYISGPCMEAARMALANPSNGFNALMTAHFGAFGLDRVDPIDWTAASSVQYWQVNAAPDDLEESTPSKYPMVFHYTESSSNQYLEQPATFSGTVTQVLAFWYSDKQAKLSRRLEKTGNLVEAAVNTIFADAAWPQKFGCNAVCGQYPMQRLRVTDEGEYWRQGFLLRQTFTVFAA